MIMADDVRPGQYFIGTGKMFAFIALLAAVPFAVWMRPELQVRFLPDFFVPFHAIAELLSVVVAASIFGIGWYSRHRHQPARNTMLACSFLVVALLNLGHLLSFPGMTDFVTPNTASKALYFWVAFRLVLVAGVMAAQVLPARLELETPLRWSMLIFSLGMTSITYWLVLFRSEWLPEVHVGYPGLTGFREISEYLVMALDVGAAWFYLRPSQANQNGARLMAMSLSVLAVSEWSLTAYATTSDIYTVVGHLYSTLGLGGIYVATFVNAVQKPYQELASSREAMELEKERAEVTLQSIGDGVITTDSQGCILSANPVAQHLVGCSNEEAIGRPFGEVFQLVDESNRAPLPNPVERCLRERRALFLSNHAMLVSRMGTAYVVEHSVAPIFTRRREILGAVMVFRDVTERKRSEDMVRQSEASMNEAQRLAHVGSWSLDLVTGELTWSDEIFRIFELDPDRFGASYEAFLEAVHPDDRQLVDKAYSDSVKNKKPYSITHRLLLPNGRVKYVSEQCETHYDADGVPLRSFGTVQDVTERMITEKKLRSVADYARNLIEANPDPMMVTDLNGVMSDVNRAAEEMTRLPRSELLGRHIADCFTSRGEVEKLLRQVFRAEEVRKFSLTMVKAQGASTDVRCSLTPYRNDSGEVQGAFLVAHDITDLKQYETQMLFQATCDALTALPNRLQFREHLGQAIARAQEFERVLGVMFIDLDNFKDINDTLGHSAGDELLKLTADRLETAVRQGDTVGRMGGDEFAVLMEDVSNVSEVELAAERLRRTVTEPYLVDGHEIVISCSIGITLYPFDDGDVDALLRNADTAMYRAKAEGKNAYQNFTAEMNDSIRRRVEIGNHLRRAVNASEFALHFQPRAELGGGTVSGVEALIRWNSGGLGMVSPAEFIPVAENNGLIVPIGEWVLHEACRQAKQWLDETGMPVNMAVNLSARQFKDVDIARTVVQALEQSGLPAGMLELELTESMLMHDTKRVLRTLETLKEIGVSLAVDDFGTGYSSLSYLKMFPIDYLKVDRSFVMDVPNDPNNEAIVRAIIAMAHGLGLKVIAEGVETAAQLDFLLAQGCDEIQGYYFSKPLPPDGLKAFLKDGCQLEESYACLTRSRLDSLLKDVQNLKAAHRFQ